MVGDYKRLGKSEQDAIFKKAIDNAIEKTRQMENGEARMKAVKMACIDQTHTTAGAASAIHYSYWTTLIYIREFLDLVNEEAGFFEAEE